MLNYLLVFVGGGLGSICRYGIGELLRKQDYNFPLATFLANVISCIILGALVGYALKQGMESHHKSLLMVGFCGGFSTFSTFTNETYQLFLTGHSTTALLYVGLSLVVCLLCIFIGLKLVA